MSFKAVAGGSLLVLAAGGLLFLSSLLSAAEPDVERLWPGEPPGAKKVKGAESYKEGLLRNVHIPTLTVFLPEEQAATGTAVVVCPGGGYGVLAIDHEGTEIAEWLNSLGIAAFVVKYRNHPYKHPIPLQDAQRATKMVRSRASEYKVEPDRIGIIGFSAGGHLVSTAGTHFHEGPLDGGIEEVTDRPDFMILLYPVISMKEGVTHTGSRQNLLGENPSEEQIEGLSNELQVTGRTPPTFLVHATDDETVPVENSILFYRALQAEGVPTEMHIYERGGHGFGLRPSRGVAASDWPGRCEKWMRQRGLLARPDEPKK